MTNRRKIIFLIIFIIVISIVLTIVYSITPKSYLNISVAPQSVYLSIDNGTKKMIKNTETITIKPGKHVLKISQDEFSDFTETITIKDRQTLELLVALNPLTDKARSLEANNTSQSIIQRFHGKNYSSQTNQITKDYPILSVLPIDARLYTVSACQSQKYPNDTTKIALCVDEYQDGLNLYVLKDITSRGYNPNNYEIIWVPHYPSGE